MDFFHLSYDGLFLPDTKYVFFSLNATNHALYLFTYLAYRWYIIDEPSMIEHTAHCSFNIIVTLL